MVDDLLLELDEAGVASLLAAIGFPFYEAQIIEHGITGEILVHLDHEALKDVGIHSVGQRLAILKAVYSLKITQNIPVEEGHYVPPSDDIELGLSDTTALESIPAQRLLGMLGERDDRIRNLELEVQRLNDTFPLRDDNQMRSSTKARPAAIARSPTGVSFPHPLSNASTLGRSNSHTRPRPVIIDNSMGPESPRSPMDFSRLFVDSEERNHQQPHQFGLHASGRSEDHAFTSDALTPTTPTAPISSPSSQLQLSQQQHQQQQQLHEQQQQQRAEGILPSLPSKLSPTQTSPSLLTSTIASTSMLPSAAAATGSLSKKPTSAGSDKDRSGSSSDNPYRSFRVTLEDPCHKVLPAALKKYKINDDWRQYALFICYGNTERCLSYDEKPLLLFQRLKEANANPVFMLRHIKDIKSPIAVASAKHAARRDKRSPNAGIGLDSPPTVNRDGSSLLPIASKSMATRQASSAKDVRDRIVVDDDEEEELGYCISIYPYLAERDDEFDVAVGDSFSIISKTKGWWVVYRATPSNSSFSTSYPRKSAWVPAGCLLETSVPPLSLADPSLSSPLTNAASIPILPHYIVSISTAGTALMDYVKSGSDELEVAKGTSLRILKRYNHWSYAVKEETGERGWIPSWFVNKTPSSSSASPPADIKTGSGSNTILEKRARSGSIPPSNLMSNASAPIIELDGIAATGRSMKNVFDSPF